MKCPGCRFVSSDLRDLCPKCLLDLRPYKLSSGLPVTYANISYEELLVKAGKKASTPSGRTERKSLLVRFVEKLLEPAPKAVSPTAREEDAKPKKSEPESLFSIKEAELTPKVFNRPLGTYNKVEAPEIKPKPQPESKPEPPPESVPLVEEPKVTESANGHQELTPPEVRPPVPPFEIPVYRHTRTDFSDIQSSFGNAALELSSQAELPFEFSTAQLGLGLDEAKAQLLFELAHEEILNPEKREIYSKPVIKSEAVTIKADELAQALKKVEAKITAPAFSLKGPSQKPKFDDADEVSTRLRTVLRPEEMNPAGIFSRTLAFVLDFATTILIAAILCFSYLIFAEPALWETFIQPGGPEALDLLPIGGLFFFTFVLSLFLYPLTALLFFSQTFGLKALDLRLIKDNGYPLALSNIVVRTFSLPISFLLFGYVGPLFGTRTLHDYLGRTLLVKSP